MHVSYKGLEIAVVTRHGKDAAIRPVVEMHTGAKVRLESRLDTDCFGTFTREIARPGTQASALRSKLQQGMNRYGHKIGIASEGAFSPHPYGFCTLNVEMVMLIDTVHNLSLHGMHETAETNYSHAVLCSFEEVVDFANKAGFPSHHLIMRPDHSNAGGILKDIDSVERLERAFHECMKISFDRKVFIETDMRADRNPTRMKAIRMAAMDLIALLNSRCPYCETPGFAVTERLRGLPCEICGSKTRGVTAEIKSCNRCGHIETYSNPYGEAEQAMYCDLCNP